MEKCANKCPFKTRLAKDLPSMNGTYPPISPAERTGDVNGPKGNRTTMQDARAGIRPAGTDMEGPRGISRIPLKTQTSPGIKPAGFGDKKSTFNKSMNVDKTSSFKVPPKSTKEESESHRGDFGTSKPTEGFKNYMQDRYHKAMTAGATPATGSNLMHTVADSTQIQKKPTFEKSFQDRGFEHHRELKPDLKGDVGKEDSEGRIHSDIHKAMFEVMKALNVVCKGLGGAGIDIEKAYSRAGRGATALHTNQSTRRGTTQRAAGDYIDRLVERRNKGAGIDVEKAGMKQWSASSSQSKHGEDSRVNTSSEWHNRAGTRPNSALIGPKTRRENATPNQSDPTLVGTKPTSRHEKDGLRHQRSNM